MNRREELQAEFDYLAERGMMEEADAVWQKLSWLCQCGEPADEQYDAYGIYAGRHCDECFQRKFRQDAYFDHGYAGEYLEPDDY